uniref:phosphoribosylaminoimidazolesuccinocarboxamide synthase n=1 Tax=Albugo laibachii Nc14 TaxID=890382 RepID=F0WZY5_9STRA|nr:phosphoribosylaminoimidazolesuccinocarboxamide synthase putative [Albugo laibachii Nc14]|eukprot:CCA27066.1 phosphoribosylaminoimidazolesuccinocarboxamide synthase putative [Albugo laibachii Nc14]
MEDLTQHITPHVNLDDRITSTSLEPLKTLLPPFTRHSGKVRDIYRFPDRILLIATDRQSAFDRVLASIPYKGRVLTLTSLWWFDQTKHIVPNHVIASPHPSAIVGKICRVFPVEFVVRGYITGSTSTSMWTHYASGCREYCGHRLVDGYVQHQKLHENLVTPTTKGETHDELISGREIVASNLMKQSEWDYCCEKALELFAYGQQRAQERGLILVDTKYEFGVDETGTILIVDEMHTPDSSRFWLQKSYKERMQLRQAPESIDKEFLRVWFKERCDPYSVETLPEAPSELVTELSSRYILLFELITGQKFEFPTGLRQNVSCEQELLEGVKEYFKIGI